MASGSPQDAATVTEQLKADPTFQQLLQKTLALAQKANAGDPAAFQAAQTAEAETRSYLDHSGIVPNDWEWDFKQGTLVKKGWGDRNPLLRGALLVGGAVAAPAAFGAAGSAAGPSAAATAPAASSGVGIGETGATVGLGGAGASSSILGRAGSIAGRVAPVLGGAAESMAKNQQANNTQTLANDYYKLNAPAKKMGNAVQASVLKNAQPVKAQWGGPGSGLRGESVHYDNAPSPALLDPEAHALGQDTLHTTLANQLSGADQPPDPSAASAGAKGLGGASLFASLLAALRAKSQGTA